MASLASCSFSLGIALALLVPRPVRADESVPEPLVADPAPTPAPSAVPSSGVQLAPSVARPPPLALSNREPPPTERRSEPLLAIGIITTSLGGAAMLTGFFFLVSRACDDTAPPQCSLPKPEIGIPLLLAGVGALAVGIPLIAYGNHRVPRSPSPSAYVRVAPMAGALTVRF